MQICHRWLYSVSCAAGARDIACKREAGRDLAVEGIEGQEQDISISGRIRTPSTLQEQDAVEKVLAITCRRRCRMFSRTPILLECLIWRKRVIWGSRCGAGRGDECEPTVGATWELFGWGRETRE